MKNYVKLNGGEGKIGQLYQSRFPCAAVHSSLRNNNCIPPNGRSVPWRQPDTVSLLFPALPRSLWLTHLSSFPALRNSYTWSKHPPIFICTASLFPTNPHTKLFFWIKIELKPKTNQYMWVWVHWEDEFSTWILNLTRQVSALIIFIRDDTLP